MTTSIQLVGEAAAVRARPAVRWHVVRTEGGRDRLEMVWAVPGAEPAPAPFAASAVPSAATPAQRRPSAHERL